MPSKQALIAQWLLTNRNFSLVPPTPAQLQAFLTVSTAQYSYLRHCTQLLGTMQGYYVMQTNGLWGSNFCLAKVYRKGNSHSTPIGVATLAGVPHAIAMQIAWGAQTRSANMGVWQRQLAQTHPHLLTPKQRYVLGIRG